MHADGTGSSSTNGIIRVEMTISLECFGLPVLSRLSRNSVWLRFSYIRRMLPCKLYDLLSRHSLTYCAHAYTRHNRYQGGVAPINIRVAAQQHHVVQVTHCSNIVRICHKRKDRIRTATEYQRMSASGRTYCNHRVVPA